MATLSRPGRQRAATRNREPQIRVLLCGTGRTGVGQTVRLTRIARWLRRVGRGRASATVATGVPGAADLFGSSDYDVVQLNMAAVLTRWGRQGGAGGTDARAALETELLEVIDAMEPHVFVTPHHAGIAGELPRVYTALRDRGVRIVLALRDQYDASDFADRVQLVNHLRDFVDQVIICAPRRATHGIPDEVLCARHAPVAFLGFVGPSMVAGRRARPGTARSVTCQVGGGIDGSPVMQAAVAGARRARALGSDVTLRLVPGPFTPQGDVAALSADLGEVGTVSKWVFRDGSPPSPAELLRVSMGGYNTCIETACDGVPALLFPRSNPGDIEQARRAAWFAANFPAVTTVANDDVSRMVATIVEALVSPAEGEAADIPADLLVDPQVLCRKLLGESLSARVFAQA